MNDLIDNNSKENIESTLSEKHIESLKIIYIPLHDGTWVEERFFNEVLQQIRKRLSALEPGQSLTVKVMCGEEYWKSLKKGEPLIAGKCVVHAVALGYLPLCFAGKTKSNSSLYQRK